MGLFSTIFHGPLLKNVSRKTPNDPLPSQISKAHRQYLCLSKSAHNIDFLACMKSLKSITLYTQIDQYSDSQSQKLLILTMIS